MNKIFYIISGFIILVLAAVCIITVSSKPTYSKLNYDKLSTIKNGLVYFGELDSDVTKTLKKYSQSYTIKEYVITEFDQENLNSYLEQYKLDKFEEKGYLYIDNNIPVWSGSKTFDESSLNETLDKFLFGKLKSSEIVYKVPNNIDELIKSINSKKYTVFVLGKSNCSYCTLYQPVINNIVSKYNIDIYYLDRTTYSESDYKKFQNLALEVKEECNKGVATTTKEFDRYPLTMITKNGKSVDCLLGYENEEDVVALLTKYNIIK